MEDSKKSTMNDMKRYIAGTSPNIFVTKCHDLKTGQMTYDLYLNGLIDGRYNLDSLSKRFLEVIYNV